MLLVAFRIPEVIETTAALNRSREAPIAAHLALGMKQKALTASLDLSGWARQLGRSSATTCALLRSEAEAGARAFLVATPSGRKRMESAAFVAELRQRLGVPDASADVWCPKCDGVLDARSLHAATCSSGGERTLRHTAVRDLLCWWAERSGLQPEKERPGLLLPQRPEDAQHALRRPADVYLPCLSGSPAARDLAITAPQRQESLTQASREALAAAKAYAHHKSAFLDTARLCEVQGVKFVPMVAEATGAWEPAASKVLLQLSRAAAARIGADAALLHADLLQELCVAIRSHRARAILRRRAERPKRRRQWAFEA